ncbi:MAG: hypothetical protein HZB33_15555 [Nitrospirae bacterium]|nr:hypothetical protein [Nitrospirota bacterium]
MKKKIAVIVRDRQEEALRMAIGLGLSDDMIDVYVIDRRLESNESSAMSLEAMEMMGIRAYSNCAENKNMEFVTTLEMAKRLLGYDAALPY